MYKNVPYGLSAPIIGLLAYSVIGPPNYWPIRKFESSQPVLGAETTKNRPSWLFGGNNGVNIKNWAFYSPKMSAISLRAPHSPQT